MEPEGVRWEEGRRGRRGRGERQRERRRSGQADDDEVTHIVLLNLWGKRHGRSGMRKGAERRLDADQVDGSA